MKISMSLAFAIVLAFSIVLFAGKGRTAPEMYLITSFDFRRYPACALDIQHNCVVGIRFYDADSRQRLADVETTGMAGPQTIVAVAKPGTTPRRVYAVTVYLDSDQHRKLGAPGETSEFHVPDDTE